MNSQPEYSEQYYELLERHFGEERERELRWYHQHFNTPDDLAVWPPELDGGVHNP
jgi:hypothetical protein